MFTEASNFTAGVDRVFLFIIGIAFFFLIGITVTMIIFVIKYNRKKHPKAVQIKEHMALEIIWTVVPVVLVLFMFYYGYSVFIIERKAPPDAIPVKVIAKMWDWTFDYGNGKIKKDTLVVPLNKAVRLNMTSNDVTHSLYISAFRIKEDLVPGQTTHMWFIAQQTGQYEILCAEYCGLRHSYMEGIVKVVSYSEYEKWLSNLKVETVSEEIKGLKLLRKNNCLACHSLDGSVIVGPSFIKLFGNPRIVITGSREHSLIADSSYIRNSILNPDQDVVKGFSKGLMQSYQGVVKEAEIQEIIEYFNHLNGKKN
jgi:cytochrome c oxidase subunit II